MPFLEDFIPCNKLIFRKLRITAVNGIYLNGINNIDEIVVGKYQIL